MKGLAHAKRPGKVAGTGSPYDCFPEGASLTWLASFAACSGRRGRGHRAGGHELPARKIHPHVQTLEAEGTEMVVGGKNIIPILTSTLETTTSMMRKGRKMIKPNWKAVFSSLMTKAGSKT